MEKNKYLGQPDGVIEFLERINRDHAPPMETEEDSSLAYKVEALVCSIKSIEVDAPDWCNRRVLIDYEFDEDDPNVIWLSFTFGRVYAFVELTIGGGNNIEMRVTEVHTKTLSEGLENLSDITKEITILFRGIEKLKEVIEKEVK